MSYERTGPEALPWPICGILAATGCLSMAGRVAHSMADNGNSAGFAGISAQKASVMRR